MSGGSRAEKSVGPATAGASLSGRAINSIDRALYGWLGSGDRDKMREIKAFTRRDLRARLAAEAKKRDYDITRLLMLTRHCGARTTREIMTWIGVRSAAELEKPHVCVCRHCGKSFGDKPEVKAS